jgi:hypothetical protein
LAYLKSAIKNAIRSYLIYDGIGGDLSGYLETNGIIYYDPINILAASNLPTNYFDYTPWSNLSGVGPFTNSGYAWGNGWTNAQTLAGGANYPAGRFEWYTTDYGIMWFTNIFKSLVWVKASLKADTVTRTGSANVTTNLDLAKTLAISNFHSSVAVTDTEIIIDGGYSLYAGQEANLIDWGSPPADEAFMGAGSARIYMNGTNVFQDLCTVEIYYRGTNSSLGGPFDNFGESIEQTWAQAVDQPGNLYTSISFNIGSTNIPPYWPDDPDASNKVTAIGWSILGGFTSVVSILKFDGTNGFRYR